MVSNDIKYRKHKYKIFCDNNDVPIFSQYWWLDVVCGSDAWDVILIEKNGKIVATMPFHFRRKYFFNIILMPQLTQNMGPFYKYEENITNSNKLAFEEECLNEIMQKLPKTSLFLQKFHYSVTNWLPLYWKNYKQTTHYTYIIKDIKNTEQVFKNFSPSKRKAVNRANKKSLKVVYDIDAATFYNHHKSSLASRNKKILYSYKLLNNIVSKVRELNKGQIIGIKDCNDELLCCRLIVWDNKSAYSLISSANSECRKQKISDFMFYEAIKYASTYVDIFDFEGSMIKGVENSFRRFGTIQIPYFKIIKTNNLIFKILDMYNKL